MARDATEGAAGAAPEGARAPALALTGVRRSYRAGFWGRRRAALDALDLTVPRGVFLGLVGANGSGKSTLLRLAAGVEPADAGNVRVFGSDAERPAARATVGFLPEGSPWPAELRLGEGLEFLLALAGLPRSERKRRAAAALDRVGLGSEVRRTLGRCSSGQRRRFGLAQAFAREPALLLLDEPSVALDADAMAVLADWLDEARARGASAVIASHLPGDLVGRCERLAVLARGRLVIEGDTDELAALARRVDVELVLDDPDALARLRDALPEGGATWHAARPTAAGLLALERRAPGSSP